MRPLSVKHGFRCDLEKLKNFDVSSLSGEGDLIGGLDFDVKCGEAIERARGCPVLTIGTAVLEGFRRHGAGRTAVVTLYSVKTNQLETELLEATGSEVTTSAATLWEHSAIPG